MRGPRTDPAALDGAWVAQSFSGAGDIIPADPLVTTEMTLHDGRAAGTGGVNRVVTTYAATDDGTISFGVVASTRMAGPDNAMAQETMFLAAIEQAVRFEIAGDRLVLKDGGDNTLVVLSRIPPAEADASPASRL
jgi:heat shock protein HslJ